MRKFLKPFYTWVYNTSSQSEADPRSVARELWDIVSATASASFAEGESSSRREDRKGEVNAGALMEGKKGKEKKKGKKGRKENGFQKRNAFQELVEAALESSAKAGALGSKRRATTATATSRPTSIVEGVVAVIYHPLGDEEKGRRSVRECWLAIGRSMSSEDQEYLLAQLLGKYKAREVWAPCRAAALLSASSWELAFTRQFSASVEFRDRLGRLHPSDDSGLDDVEGRSLCEKTHHQLWPWPDAIPTRRRFGARPFAPRNMPRLYI